MTTEIESHLTYRIEKREEVTASPQQATDKRKYGTGLGVNGRLTKLPGALKSDLRNGVISYANWSGIRNATLTPFSPPKNQRSTQRTPTSFPSLGL